MNDVLEGTEMIAKDKKTETKNEDNTIGKLLMVALANFGITDDRMTSYMWELMANNFLGMLVNAGILHTDDRGAGQEVTE